MSLRSIFPEFSKSLKRKERKNLKAARDSTEYEKDRMRKFPAKWQAGRPWLQHDHDGVGIELLGE